MRLIYTDEAGTSPNEQVRVVASVIVEADRQWSTLNDEISRVINSNVPEQYLENFYFHGKDIFNGSNWYDRSIWSFDKRLDFFKELISLIFVMDIPISLGCVFRGSFDHVDPLPLPKSITMANFEHFTAFTKCVERADLFLRKFLKGKEVGSVIAEDVPTMRKFLTRGGLMLRDTPFEMPSIGLRQEAWEIELGIEPYSVSYEIKHIIDVPHFVEKRGAPLLQLADACAFAFRRCLSKQDHGADLILAMLGPSQGFGFLNEDTWFSKSSSGLFNTEFYWSDEYKEHQRQLAISLDAKRLGTIQ